MKLEQSFEVAAPIDRVWQALVDVEHVASKLPGAEITGRNHDGSYDGTFTIKIGPTTASYRGRLEMESVDEDTHTATMHAQGADRRGQGGASATIVSKLSETGQGATRVVVDTDYHITGRLARFGRGGMIEDISERLLREFASRLQASLGGPTEAITEEWSRTEQAPQPTEAEQGTEAEQASEAEQAAEEPAAAEAPHALEAPQPVPPPAPSGSELEPIQGLSLVGSVMANRVRRNPWPLLAAIGMFLLPLLLRLLRRRR